MFGDVYADRRVLVTGHSGFKGGWLSLWLSRMGARVSGLALPPPDLPNLHEIIAPGTFAYEFFVDLRDAALVDQAVREADPEIVFHLAAQPLVRESYAHPVETVSTNVLGTIHLLESVRRLARPVTVVVGTTDKCYENREWDYGYRETDALGGHDVYSMSKAACELAVAAWRRSFFEPDGKLGHLATVRAGNVIGGGDYARDRVIPDCMRALSAGESIRIRNPKATRPWQHVLDCLSGYLLLGSRLHTAQRPSPLASAFNFGPTQQGSLSVRDLVAEVLMHWPGSWIDMTDPAAPHEAGRLHLAIDKAAVQLGWQPTWDLSEAVKHTVDWFRHRHLQGDAQLRAFSEAQIDAFTAAAARRGQAWARSGTTA